MTPASTAHQIGTMQTLAGGRFIIEDRVGDGGSGQVFKAFDEHLGHSVALKILHVNDAEATYRIKREFRLLKPMLHVNLVRLHELFVTGEGPGFFTMELLSGWGLDEFIRNAQTPGHSQTDQLAWSRLRDTLRQITLGLQAIHDRGLVHRDLKPGNIMVLQGGRTVILDFGFAIESQPHDLKTRDFAGTPFFMAPEQMDGTAEPASDWYALGIILKNLAREIGAPEGLEALARALSYPEPGGRAGFAEINDWLAGFDSPGLVAKPASSGVFVGRAAELGKLRETLEAVTTTRTPRVAQVCGPSGIGKTDLILRLVDPVGSASAQAPLVFHSRCHLKESIRYRTLDELMDEFTRYLVAQPSSELERIRPKHIGSLVQLFPVFGRVPVFAGAGSDTDDAKLVKRFAVMALRHLLSELGSQRTTVLWIDDCQWADEESLSLLIELLKPPDAPAVMVLLSHRSADSREAEEPANKAEVAELLAHDQLRSTVVALEPLTMEEARGYCVELLGDSPEIDNIVRLAEGNPLFLSRIAREGDVSGAGNLAEWLSRQFERLPEETRSLLRLLAVCGHPLKVSQVRNIQGTSLQLLEDLCHEQWLCTRIQGGEECVDIFHDQIRLGILDAISQQEKREIHAGIVEHLKRDPSQSPLQLLNHYTESGDTQAAATFAIQAAEEALSALASRQAALLFEKSFQLRGESSEDWWLLTKAAEASLTAGHFVDAGRLIDTAIKFVDADEHPVLRTDLQSRGATAYLRGGDMDRARNLFFAAARAVGIEPGSGSDLRTLLVRLPFLFGPPRFKAVGPATGETRRKLEILGNLTMTITPVDGRLMSELSLRWMKEAIRVGDPEVAAQAVAVEGTIQSYFGGPFKNSGRRLVEAASKWPDQADPRNMILARNTLATVYLCEGRWREAAKFATDAEDILLRELPHEYWLLGVVRKWLFAGLSQLGELDELGTRLPPLVQGAEERGDIEQLIYYKTGWCSGPYLAQDTPGVLQASVAELEPLDGTKGFSSQRFNLLLGSLLASVYQGDYSQAWEKLEQQWPDALRSITLKSPLTGVPIQTMRAQLALAMFDTGHNEDALLKEIKLAIRALEKSGITAGRASAKALNGHLALRENKDKKARALLAKAGRLYQSVDMRLHARIAERQLAQVAPGGVDTRMVARADTEISNFGVSKPSSMARCFAPPLPE
jgi:serine/threonine protein kinase/tetratricopeptide (TPR) repeat protein